MALSFLYHFSVLTIYTNTESDALYDRVSRILIAFSRHSHSLPASICSCCSSAFRDAILHSLQIRLLLYSTTLVARERLLIDASYAARNWPRISAPVSIG